MYTKNNSLRHFDWFNCDIDVSLSFFGEEFHFHTFTSFVCAYSLRTLRACIHINRFLPRRFCSVKLSFSYLPDCLLPSDLKFNPIVKHSYSDIEQTILSEIIYVMIFNHFVDPF